MKIKVIIGLLAVGVLMFSWVQFYYLPKTEAAVEQARLDQLQPETHQFGQVLKFEHSYMGSAGNTTNLTYNLPMNDIPRMYQQDPEKFSFTINYEEAVQKIGEARVEKAILYNATAIFVLIKNMEIIEFNFPDQTYTVTRQRVNDWFGEDISTFNKENIFEENVQQPIIKKERLDDWFTAYIGGER